MWTAAKAQLLGIELAPVNERPTSVSSQLQRSTHTHTHIKKSEEAVTMSTKPAVKIGGERVSVDPQLLFQRLLHVAGAATKQAALAVGDLSKLDEIFKHELTALPSSMFDDSGLMRGSSKHLLAKHLWDASEGCKQQMLRTEDAHYILDGGSLIHQLSWLRGTS